MTRKKSNVKALALAVTCAILTGGGIGLEPVYAADVLTYDTSEHQLKNGATAIDTLTVGGVTIGGVGAITADSLALTGTDGTTNVGAAITANANNIKAVNGQVTNIKNDVNSLQTTTGQLQTKVGELTASDTAARNDIISLQKKTAGISEDGNEITTNSLKLRGSGSLEEQEITAAKVKGYDKAVAAVGDTSTGGTLAYNTQKIKFKKDNMITTDDATYIEGITHAGDVRLANGDVRAKSIVLEEVFDNDTSAQATLTRESIVNLHGMINGTTKIQVADGSEVGGVTFGQGKVTNVVSINDNLKFESDGIYLNKGDQTKQIKIDNDGKIIIGTSSSAYDTDGFYAGGDDYGAAKAGIKSDGSLKATGFTVDGATGNTTVGGDLTVAGAASFAKETAFANGIKTDKINEKNDGKGVTVDGVLLKDGGITATGNVTTTGDIQGNNITATGVLKGQTLGIGTNGSEFTVDENGNAAVGGTLGVTGKTTLSDELQVDKTATFGIATGAKTVINGDEVKTGRIETTKTQSSYIGGVTLLNGQITADNMTITGTLDMDNLKVNEKLEVGTYGVTKAGVVTGVTSINDVAVSKQGNGLKIGSATVGDTNPFSSTGFTVDNVGNVKAVKVTAGTITDGNGFTATGGNVTATGTVQGNTISDGAGATLTSGKITAKEGQIGNVTISAAGVVTGVSEIKANTFKVDDNNFLDGNGITAKGGKIGGAVIDATTLTVGVTKLDSTEGITTNKLKIGDMTLTGTGLNTGTNDFQVNGVTFNQGKVTAQADKGFVVGTSSFKQGFLIVDANNKLEATNGLTTEKATVNGTLDVTGKATFGTAGKQTTIDGDAITTDTLKANKLILGASGDTTVEVDKDGSLIAAKGKFKVDKDGALKAANGAFTVDQDGKTTFTKDADNLSSINGGNIWAKATDAANHTSSELQHDSTGLHVSGTHAGKTSAFAFDAATGISTFTGQDNSTVTINGSAIRSAKSDGTAGRLDGENLTLYKDANNQTTMSAGKATFKSDNAGKYNGKETTIDGGVITTDTLNVQRINLGKEMVNSDGTTTAVSNLSIDEHGNIKAAGGNFTVAGTDQGNNKGALHNEVGNTSFNTTVDGASMKFNNTAATGGVESKVTVEANKATVAAGDKASFVANADNGGSATITGGTQTVTTTGAGTVFENSAHNTPVEGGNATTTIINGNEITTGKITTDQLVITGQGNAHGNGSIAFGGNGTIKSDINDGTANGKNTSFETTLDGVNTKVTDGTTTTENKVTAAGNSNTVTKDEKHKSEFNQGLTSIGGVVTNGEIKVAQKLDGATGLLTNEVTNADGKWSKLEQSGTGLTYTDSANAGNATRIDSSDVSIGSATEPDKRINLSDLGQIDDLHSELKSREEFTSNPTAVGGINAEAAIRREDVARLDGRINDVNDRVNKVGAMAAAIASLKSIGYDPQAPSEFSIGLGQYKGETGVAMGFFHYPNKNFMINVSLSTAGGETMGGIGATWRFGHKSPQKLLEEQREAQARKELAAAEKYQAAAKLAKEAQERAEYAAKLARQAQVSADNAKAAADATQAKHFG